MLANGAKETTATTGTGTVTLSSVAGYPRLADVLPVGATVDYAIKSGNNWEWGVGKVGASNTLERTVVTAKYDAGTYTANPGTKLSLSGTSDVFATLHAGSVERAAPAVLRVRTNVPRQIYTGDNSQTTKATFAPAAGYVYLFPFKMETTAVVSKIGVQASSSIASAKLRVGLYEVGADGLPSRLVAESAELDPVTSNTQYLTTLGSPVEIQAGWYWAAFNSGTVSPQLHGFSMGSAPRSIFGWGSSGFNGSGVYYMARSIAALPADPSSFPLTSFTSELIGNFPNFPALILEV